MYLSPIDRTSSNSHSARRHLAQAELVMGSDTPDDTEVHEVDGDVDLEQGVGGAFSQDPIELGIHRHDAVAMALEIEGHAVSVLGWLALHSDHRDGSRGFDEFSQARVALEAVGDQWLSLQTRRGRHFLGRSAKGVRTR